MPVLGVKKDPNGVVGRVELEQNSAIEAESEDMWEEGMQEQPHSIVFSTSSSPRFVSLSRFPSVARRSPMIFSTWPQTCGLTFSDEPRRNQRGSHLVIDALLLLLLLHVGRDRKAEELSWSRSEDVPPFLVSRQRNIILAL